MFNKLTAANPTFHPSHTVPQYYQFLRLGFAGYRKIMSNLDIVRKRLINALSNTGGRGGVG